MQLTSWANLISGFVPVDMSLGDNAGDWVNLAKYKHLAIVFFKAAGTAGDDPTLTVEQATANDGSDNKALNFTKIMVKQGAALNAIAQFTKVTQSAANTYTDTDAAEEQAIWVVEFDDTDLDIDNGYTHVQASVGDVGNNAQVGALLYLATEPDFPQEITEGAID